MTTLFDIIKQNKEGSKSSIPVLQSGGLFENFKKGLGLENDNNYRGRNSNSSAVGKYQFLWGEWGDKIKAATGYEVRFTPACLRSVWLRLPDGAFPKSRRPMLPLDCRACRPRSHIFRFRGR